MLTAYIPHLCGQGEIRVCKWLQIWEGQISGFPKKSGVGVSWPGKLFFLFSAPPLGMRGSWDLYVTPFGRELRHFTLVTVSLLDLAALFPRRKASPASASSASDVDA